MHALVYAGKKKMRFTQMATPTLGHHDVLLKIHSVGICGTDLHIYNGGTSVQKGTVLGHEFSGTIAKVGTKVKRFKVGDRVVAEHVLTCGHCAYCLMGKPNLCINASIYGMDRPGALAEFMAVPESFVYKIPHTVNFDEAALIEPLTIASYASQAAGSILEQRVAVIGQGPIGLLLDQVLSDAGAEVIGIDTMPSRLQFAKRKGWVRYGLNSMHPAFRKQLQKIAPLGVDAVFEAVGKGVTAELALEIARKDGNIFLLGVFEEKSSLDLMQLVKKELNVYGSWTCAFSFPRAIELVAKKKVDLKSLVSHTYAFKDAAQAFRDSANYVGNRRKTVIHVA